MKVLVFANSKGGVGKTTSAVMAAEGFAAFHSQRVLCIDVDPQNNMTTLLMGEDERKKQKDRNLTVDQYFLGAINAQHASLDKFIVSASGHLNLAKVKKPGTVSAVAAAQRLIDTERLIVRKSADLRRELTSLRDDILRQLQQDFAALEKSYDIVIFDTPPTLNLFTEIALLACDYLIVPIVPEELSTMGLPELIGRASKTRILSVEGRDNVLILPTRYQKTWFTHGRTMDKLNGWTHDLARECRVKVGMLPQQVLTHEDYAKSAEYRGKSPTFEVKYGRAKANAKAVVKSIWQAIS